MSPQSLLDQTLARFELSLRFFSISLFDTASVELNNRRSSLKPALEWIKKHDMVTENPGNGQQMQVYVSHDRDFKRATDWSPG